LPGLDDGTGPDAADDLAKAMASSSSSSSSVCMYKFFFRLICFAFFFPMPVDLLFNLFVAVGRTCDRRKSKCE